MTTTDPKERITLWLSASLKQTIAHEAEEAGQTLSIWVERALARHVKTKAAESNG